MKMRVNIGWENLLNSPQNSIVNSEEDENEKINSKNKNSKVECSQ